MGMNCESQTSTLVRRGYALAARYVYWCLTPRNRWTIKRSWICWVRPRPQ